MSRDTPGWRAHLARERQNTGNDAQALAAGYARWRTSTLGRVTDEIERALLLELIGDVGGRSVLDVGCGDGELAVELWKRGAKVTGVDAAPEMIAAARERAAREGADIAFEVATAQSLPLPSEAFERVVAVTVLCFVEDASPVMAEMARVLRPGGRLVIGELGRWNIWAAARRIGGWLGHPIWRRARFRTGAELRAAAEAAGLVVEALRGAVYYPPLGIAARLLGPIDPHIARRTTAGAAFLALAVARPEA